MRFLIVGVACAAIALAGLLVDSPAAGSDAIDWQTDRVDLQAAGLELELFDQVFSPVGADVSIDEGASGKRRWYMDVRWAEGEHRHALVFNFRHSDVDWYVDTVNWWVEGPVSSDDVGRYGSAAFRLRNRTRSPLEEPFSGDIRRTGNGVQAGCDGRRLSMRETDPDGATLTIDGLRVEVTPRGPTLIERALRRLGLTRKLDQDLDLLAEDCSLDQGDVRLIGERQDGQALTP